MERLTNNKLGRMVIGSFKNNQLKHGPPKAYQRNFGSLLADRALERTNSLIYSYYYYRHRQERSVLRVLKEVSKMRYLFLGGAVAGAVLQKTYQSWKDGKDDKELPELQGNSINFKDNRKD